MINANSLRPTYTPNFEVSYAKQLASRRTPEEDKRPPLKNGSRGFAIAIQKTLQQACFL